MMAQEAASKEVANSTLRRHLAGNKMFNSANVKIGDPVLPYKPPTSRARPDGADLHAFRKLMILGSRHDIGVRLSRSRDTVCVDGWMERKWLVMRVLRTWNRAAHDITHLCHVGINSECGG